MRILHIHAHFDDHEFTAGGTFELWRRSAPTNFAARLIVCTDGCAGHHAMSREETGRVRLEEQKKSAAIGNLEFELLRLPDGSVPREGCLQDTPELLPALWKTIREFQPDYLFCPPLPVDNLAGVHADHLAVAEAIRRVAYFINVPHAFTPEFPAASQAPAASCPTPVILTVFDGYMAGPHACDLVVDVEEAFETICQMSWCHQSQIMEWLPWIGRHRMSPPANPEAWARTLRRRFQRQQTQLGLPTDRACEVFTVTAWGEIPNVAQLQTDFPPLDSRLSRLDDLYLRLSQWHSGED